MGIGEPLIYGVTLPLGKPFIGACIGGAFGGAVQAYFHVGATSIGLFGLPLTASTDNIGCYLIGLITAYIFGFIATILLVSMTLRSDFMQFGISIYVGLDNTLDENLGLSLYLAHQHHIQRIFTSLHIPETNLNSFKQDLAQILALARQYNMEVISDISPNTLNYLRYG